MMSNYLVDMDGCVTVSRGELRYCAIFDLWKVSKCLLRGQLWNFMEYFGISKGRKCLY